MDHTKVTIKQTNRHLYTSGIYPEITYLIWKIRGHLDGKILKNFPNLTQLRCYDKGIVSLEGIESCPNLEWLNIIRNKITDLSPLHHCPKLKVIMCWNNFITNIEFLQYCPNIEYLDISYNRIHNLEPIKYIINNLKYFSYDICAITKPISPDVTRMLQTVKERMIAREPTMTCRHCSYRIKEQDEEEPTCTRQN